MHASHVRSPAPLLRSERRLLAIEAAELSWWADPGPSDTASAHSEGFAIGEGFARGESFAVGEAGEAEATSAFGAGLGAARGEGASVGEAATWGLATRGVPASVGWGARRLSRRLTEHAGTGCEFVGMLASVGAAGLSSIAGVYFEFVIKRAQGDAPPVSLWVRNMQLCCSTIPVAALGVFFQRRTVFATGDALAGAPSLLNSLQLH